ncbi:MAG: helix-turn-helix transcriptional regulator [Desulfobulbus sp.]|jgi:transcriptional regulator with XRE-family HTH domain
MTEKLSSLREIIKASKILQKDIAANIGCSPAAVSMVINGKAKSRRIMLAIADALGKPVAEVFPDEEAKQ